MTINITRTITVTITTYYTRLLYMFLCVCCLLYLPKNTLKDLDSQAMSLC